MIIRDGHRPASRHAKRASVLQLGDAIRLESGKRVVITYVSRGFAPTERYIEWRGHGPNNWANVPLDTSVRLAWRLRRVWTPYIQQFATDLPAVSGRAFSCLVICLVLVICRLVRTVGAALVALPARATKHHPRRRCFIAASVARGRSDTGNGSI
jgi:hypothetical protein